MKRILLAVSGLNPQVITEALYCLHQEQRFVDALHIITTRKGKDLLLARLIGGGSGALYGFLDEYKISQDKIDFHPGNIHTLADKNGKEVDDIITQIDNERFLELCLEISWKLSNIEQTAIYYVVSGGRKTMASCLTLAAQLYGRKQDRIYHVLVSPEFESNPDFWYPAKTSKHLALRDEYGEIFHKETKYAKLHLVPIPFVSVREQLSDTLLVQPHSPGTLLLSLVKDEERILRLSLRNGTVAYGRVEIDMLPARLALYAFFCELKKRCLWLDRVGCDDCNDCFLTAPQIFNNQERITNLYRQICDGGFISEMSDTGIISLSSENFNSYKSKIRSDLQRVFGAAANDLLIVSKGKRPDTKYGIELCKSNILIEL